MRKARRKAWTRSAGRPDLRPCPERGHVVRQPRGARVPSLHSAAGQWRKPARPSEFGSTPHRRAVAPRAERQPTARGLRSDGPARGRARPASRRTLPDPIRPPIKLKLSGRGSSAGGPAEVLEDLDLVAAGLHAELGPHPAARAVRCAGQAKQWTLTGRTPAQPRSNLTCPARWSNALVKRTGQISARLG